MKYIQRLKLNIIFVAEKKYNNFRKNVKKVKLLNIIFDSEIRNYEIPAFRGALIDKVGKDNILFHNHLGDNAYLYKYPLIQYKQLRNKPAIICIEHGVDEIHKYFEKDNWDLRIGDRYLSMKIFKLNMHQFTIQLWDKLFDYTIINWLGLNQENYKKYISISSLTEKIVYLERLLQANILSFAKGIDWTIDKEIELKITDITNEKIIKLKGVKVMAFDLKFKTNIFLPNYIGLGKSVSIGFGMIKQDRVLKD